MAQLGQIASSENWKPRFSSMSQKSKIVFNFFLITNFIFKLEYDPYVYIACFEFMHALVYFNTITFNNTKSQYSITENMYSSGVVLAIQGATPRSCPQPY